MPDLDAYLDAIRRELGRCPPEVMAELRQHIRESAAAFRSEGYSPDDAMALAIREFGDPAEIAAGLATCCGTGRTAMLRRVGVPALVATGVWLATAFVGAGLAQLSRKALDVMLQERQGAVLPPILPDLDWLLFLVVFLAVHMCATRGGSRRECLLVGATPALVSVVAYGGVLLALAGPWSLVYGMGFANRVMTGGVTIGTMLAARAYLADLLGVIATCLGATWLYFFAADRLASRPLHPVSE